MTNADNYKTPNPVKSKLLKLKEWLTVPEAAKYLSTIFGEEVNEADVLRLALDRHLKLSVLFVNHAHAMRGDSFVPFKEWEENFRSKFSWENMEVTIGPENMLTFRVPEYGDVLYAGKLSGVPGRDKWDEIQLDKLKMDFLDDYSPETQADLLASVVEALIEDHKKVSETFKGKVPPSITSFHKGFRSIEGVWDLPLLGSERLDIEHKYQQLTDGPAVTLIVIDGTFVENQSGEVWQLQNQFDKEYLEYLNDEDGIIDRIAYYDKVLKEKILKSEIDEEEASNLLEQRKKNLNRKRNHSDNYYPAGGLPQDSVVVVRTSALLDLQERISEEHAESKPASPKTEKSNLHIIGALLQIVMDEKLFPSEAALREHIARQYQGYSGCAERTLAGRFAEAKKTLSE